MKTTTEKINFDRFDACRRQDMKETMLLLRSSGAIFMSWGGVAFTNIRNKALRFKSNGYLHKGHVYISVNGLDLYDVLLTTCMGRIVKEINGLYFDQLVEVIDENIEQKRK